MTTEMDDPIAHAYRAAVPREVREYQGGNAGLVSRVLASAVDFLLTLAVLLAGYGGVLLVRFLLRPRSFRLPTPSYLLALLVGVAVFVAYLVISWTTSGSSVGDRLLGLRVTDKRGESPHVIRAILRAVLCVWIPIGLLWAAIDRKNRSLQDLLLGTSVVYDWSPRRTRAVSEMRGSRASPAG